MGRPAGLDGGEITDKGYVNQRRVLINRADAGRAALRPAGAGVIVADHRKDC